MKDDRLLRYSRQILLPAIGVEGQERLRQARVLVVGLGGLGSPAALYLAAAGVGTLILADYDVVELSNLQRQILHTTDRLGLGKVDSAMASLHALDPDIHLEGYPGILDESSLPALVAGVDAIVEGSDNFSTRFAVNAACYRAGKPLISGAVIRAEGQVSVFPGRPGGPCYQCLYPRAGAVETGCAANGVLAPVAGIIGCIQATETLKVLLGLGQSLCGQLLLLDAMTMEFRRLRLPADPACPLCASAAPG